MILSIALKSLNHRLTAVLLTMLSIIVSVSLLLSVEHLRIQAKDSFGRTISGVDLIVGAPTGQSNLLLYSVFRIGNPTNNVSWDSYQALAKLPSVKWIIPIALGDSHRGFRVLGTNNNYFQHFQYGSKQPLVLAQGTQLLSTFDAVIGAAVAKKLNYQLGDEIEMSHGLAEVSFTKHSHSPFVVKGILEPTGTPVDQTIHVSLAGLEAAHKSESEIDEILHQIEAGEQVDIDIDGVTAMFIGLNSKMQLFQLQRGINQYKKEPMLAIIPGVAFSELWQLVGNVENMLLFISALILFSSLLGLGTMLLTTVRERRHEMAILRAIGAHSRVIFLLIQMEAMLLSLFASVIALILVWLGFQFGAKWLSAEYGLFIENSILGLRSLAIIGLVSGATFLIACIPAISAYRQSIQQGLISK
ncbi:ABC transporter permease [Aliiglaciecola sp. 3_MG-2023]|uniref:ABC transporter permease n=1 Tax=Aliiglaciecola sp. 3_MG-2023 TaxID=3062644 RepID=UPI0026E40545|nr:ABC transporter permease [Aliiglaciecola sp. 3_MG-2023]MDO6693786.1 ABC transporter permease [Aliiglaciecola sp. 3_MG-2023]